MRIPRKLRLPTMTNLRALAAVVALAAYSAGAAAQPSEAMQAPLLSNDPKQPIEVLADKAWSAGQIRIQPREVTGTPKDLPRSSRTLNVATFRHDAGRGPATLVVDYAAFLTDPSGSAEGTVSIDIECPSAPHGCAYPITKGVLLFQSTFMARQQVETAAGKRTLAVGRESHSYTLPATPEVEVRVRLLEPTNLEPVELKARIIYGEYDRRALPGQTTRSGLLWMGIGGAVVFLLLVFWWLRRS